MGALLGGRVSPTLRQALTRMLEPNPDARPTNIRALLHDVAERETRGGGRAPQEREKYRSVFDKIDGSHRSHLEETIRRKVERAKQKAERQVEKKVRRAVARAERQARREGGPSDSHRGPFALPWIGVMAAAMPDCGSCSDRDARIHVRKAPADHRRGTRRTGFPKA